MIDRPRRRVASLMALAVALTACSTPVPAAPTATPTTQPSPPSASPSASPSLEGWLLLDWFVERDVKDLILVRPDGTERHAIASTIEPTLAHYDGHWSPDGSTIAFQVGEWYLGGSIWTVDADGGEPTLLLGPSHDCRLGVAFPAWSPDGGRLLFVCQDGSSGTDPDVHETLMALDLATGATTPVVTFRGNEELLEPAWSRDGTAAVFTIQDWTADLTEATGSSIASVPIAGGTVTELTERGGRASSPSWSPVADRIVFTTNGFLAGQGMDLPSTIETMAPDGSERIIVAGPDDVPAGARLGGATWTPDGAALLASIATGDDTITDIYPAMLTLDGDLTRIAGSVSGVGDNHQPGG